MRRREAQEAAAAAMVLFRGGAGGRRKAGGADRTRLCIRVLYTKYRNSVFVSLPLFSVSIKFISFFQIYLLAWFSNLVA